MTFPSNRFIFFFVFAVHLVAFIFISLSSSSHLLPQTKKKLAINTITLPKETLKVVKVSPKIAPPNPPKTKSVKEPPQKKVKTPLPKKEPLNQLKPEAKKSLPLAKKEPLPKSLEKKKTLEKSAPKVPSHLLEELESSFSKIEKKRISPPVAQKKLNSEVNAPSTINEPSLSKKELENQEIALQKELIQYLHNSLHLPEFGEVKIQLSLRFDGSVVNLQVLKSESEKNRAYLEKTLPRMTFPIFLMGNRENKQKTFIFTFCNEL